MPANPVLWSLDQRGVATVTLNRPEVNNAYDAGLIDGVLSAMDELGRKPLLRVVVLKGNGKHFQAGADLKWINAVRPQSPAFADWAVMEWPLLARRGHSVQFTI